MIHWAFLLIAFAFGAAAAVAVMCFISFAVNKAGEWEEKEEGDF